MSFLSWFGSKKLSQVLFKTYTVKVQGVKFVLRKIQPLDFMDGSKAVQMVYTTYEEARKKGEPDAPLNSKKIKEHYAAVFMASVVEPVLILNEKDCFDETGAPKGIWVQHLFSDWSLANELYVKISELTYGKKKSIASFFRGRG